MTTWRSALLALSMLLIILAGCDAGTGSKLINGTKLPDVTLPNLEGKDMSLSDLEGNIVLVDLWASWCKPCRKQHPYLVELYQKYENVLFQDSSRFIIYQVSLDQDGDAWRKAIKSDKLYWPHHVSELKGWNTDVVELYDIESIPASFLIDTKGQIIGKNLRIFEIEKILERRRLAQ